MRVRTGRWEYGDIYRSDEISLQLILISMAVDLC